MIKWEDHIVSDPEVLVGKPTIKGTRLAVEFILQLFKEGWSKEEFFENYPRLTANEIEAVFAYLIDNKRDSMLGVPVSVVRG